jgi:hypothetical protein
MSDDPPAEKCHQAVMTSGEIVEQGECYPKAVVSGNDAM